MNEPSRLAGHMLRHVEAGLLRGNPRGFADVAGLVDELRRYVVLADDSDPGIRCEALASIHLLSLPALEASLRPSRADGPIRLDR